MKTLTIGADPFPPYQYYDDEGTIRGSDYEAVKSIIDQMNYTANYVIDEWPLVEKAFSNKEVDIVFQVQKTPEREKNYFFSNKLRDATTSFVTSTGKTDQKSIDELFADKSKLGVIEGYMYGDIIDTIAPDNKTAFTSLEELLESVNNGSTEFGVVDLGVYNYINRDKKYNHVKLLSEMNFNRPLYVCFNDESIRDMFNLYLKKTNGR